MDFSSTDVEGRLHSLHCAILYKRFEYPWCIAQFVISGERLEKPAEISDKAFELISKCWCSNPKERLTIEEITEKLEKF